MRPKRLDELIGQDHIKKEIEIRIKATLLRKECFPHGIICGGTGLGKSSLAYVIANELNKPLKEFNGSCIVSPKDLFRVVLGIKKGDVIFIDEIHRLGIKCQEFLYPVMEDFKLLFADKSVLSVDRFTLIGATTHLGRLSQPLQGRFPIKLVLQPYSVQELATIARHNLARSKLRGNQESYEEIGRRSKGIPRILNNLVKWIADVALVEGIKDLDKNFIIRSLNKLGVDANGLDQYDRDYLEFVKKNQPVSLNTIASALNVDRKTVEESIEPFLISQNLISRTTKGRVLNDIEIFPEGYLDNLE